MEKEPVIAAKGLAGGYPGNPVWKNADFSIERGEFVAVLGPNGAGKTTLFNTILGLLPPLEGSLAIFGKPPRRGNSSIGFVPQMHSFDTEAAIEARELVRLGFDGHRWGIGSSKIAALNASKALALAGASDLAGRPLGALSGGELQRIFLAEALVGKPDLLLLDEPLANMDIRRETDLVRLISDIVRAQGVTVLLIAHNINPLLPVIDRVVYVANGRITIGKPDEVMTSKTLTDLYGTPIEVLRDSKGRMAILGMEEGLEHHLHRHHHHE